MQMIFTATEVVIQDIMYSLMNNKLRETVLSGFNTKSGPGQDYIRKILHNWSLKNNFRWKYLRNYAVC